MPRKPRIVIPNHAHHVVQRGSRKQTVFFTKEDYEFYLNWFKEYSTKYNIQVLAYCLMSNHVHHILIPEKVADLSKFLKSLHVKYAFRINKRHDWQGHLWQERYFSTPMDETYIWSCIRYVERNPVDAGIVTAAWDYEWSSANSRCNGIKNSLLNCNQNWSEFINQKKNWKKWLGEEEDLKKIERIRERTRRDLPCGTDRFVNYLEQKYHRSLKVKSVGRPRKE